MSDLEGSLEGPEGFHANCDFVTVNDGAWPRRMFRPIVTARVVFAEE